MIKIVIIFIRFLPSYNPIILNFATVPPPVEQNIENFQSNLINDYLISINSPIITPNVEQNIENIQSNPINVNPISINSSIITPNFEQNIEIPPVESDLRRSPRISSIRRSKEFKKMTKKFKTDKKIAQSFKYKNKN